MFGSSGEDGIEERLIDNLGYLAIENRHFLSEMWKAHSVQACSN